jgi:hypothetical protein
MRSLLENIKDSLADAALLEMATEAVYAPRHLMRAFRESLEEHFV